MHTTLTTSLIPDHKQEVENMTKQKSNVVFLFLCGLHFKPSVTSRVISSGFLLFLVHTFALLLEQDVYFNTVYGRDVELCSGGVAVTNGGPH